MLWPNPIEDYERAASAYRPNQGINNAQNGKSLRKKLSRRLFGWIFQDILARRIDTIGQADRQKILNEEFPSLLFRKLGCTLQNSPQTKEIQLQVIPEYQTHPRPRDPKGR